MPHFAVQQSLSKQAPANGQWQFGAASLYWCDWHTSFGAGSFARSERNSGRKHAQTDFGCGIDRGIDPGRSGRGAIADRHQVQPRRRDRTRRRGWRPRSSRNWPRSTPTARSRSKSIRTRSSTRTRKSSKRCSSARCRCWRPRTPSSARSASRNSRCSICPIILPDLKTLRKVTDGPLGARLLKLLDSKGMTGLAYWDNGFKR